MTQKLLRATHRFATFMFILALTGCDLREHSSTLDQHQRESITEKTVTDVVNSSKIVPPSVTATMKDGNATLTVQAPVPSEQKTEVHTGAGVNSDSEASGSATATIKFPLWVGLLGGAVALCIFAALGTMLYRKSAAVRAAWQWMNDHVANAVHQNRTLQTTETDPKVLAALKTQEAALERLRADANE